MLGKSAQVVQLYVYFYVSTTVRVVLEVFCFFVLSICLWLNFVNTKSYKLLKGTSSNLQVWCTREQRWTDQVLRSKRQSSGLWRELIWSKIIFWGHFVNHRILSYDSLKWIGLSNHKLKSVLKCSVWSQCMPVTDGQGDEHHGNSVTNALRPKMVQCEEMKKAKNDLLGIADQCWIIHETLKHWNIKTIKYSTKSQCICEIFDSIGQERFVKLSCASSVWGKRFVEKFCEC